METQRYHPMTPNRSRKEDIVWKSHVSGGETESCGLTMFRNPVARPGLPKNRPTFGRRQGRGALSTQRRLG